MAEASDPKASSNGDQEELKYAGAVEDAVTLMQPSLRFKSLDIEAQYLKTVSGWRRPVLTAIMSFDVFCFFVRITWQVGDYLFFDGPGERVREVLRQLWNLGFLYVLVGLINWRSKRIGYRGAQQVEALLTGVMALAICNLLISLEGEKTDYVMVCMFLISGSTILKIRWWMGAAFFFLCVLTASCLEMAHSKLPSDALGHIFIAWMCGTMVGYQSDYGRREMFASQERAEYAHRKEMEEAQARIQAQRELTAAQVLATEKSVLMAKEVAASGAKSEFMSVMCHEIRTPLNGCLASVEMLLETALQEDQRELACIIRVCGRILLSTVSNFLDFFKIEAGGVLDLVETEVDLPKLMSEIQGVIQAMVGVDNQEIDIKDPVLHNVPKVILGDSDRLRGIILNLYSNAAKFTRKGMIEVSVEVLDRDTAPEPGPAYDRITLPPHQSSLTSPSIQKAQTPLDKSSIQKSPSLGLIAQTERRKSTSNERSDSEDGGEEKWLLFQVRDTGVGISGVGLKSLFKEYAQGSDEDMQRPRTNAGTGLGLNICLKQVGALGGRIGAFSKLGSGSVFWFTFPLKTPKNCRLQRRTTSWSGPIDLVTEQLEPQTFRSISPQCLKSDVWINSNKTQPPLAGLSKLASEESTDVKGNSSSASSGDQEKESLDGRTSLKGCRVLLVEDNLMNQKVAQKMLQSFCAKCKIASNGLEALDVLLGTNDENKSKSDEYDIVLMDMLMPKMGGIEATKILRQRNVKIPIVALTANALESDYEECRIAGMDGFLSKPVLKGQLRECLLRVLRSKNILSEHNT